MRKFALLGLVVTWVAVLPETSEAIIAEGACCTGTQCTITFAEACVEGGGTYQGDFSTCEPAVCAPPVVPSVGSGGLVVLAVALLGAATWLLVRRGRRASES